MLQPDRLSPGSVADSARQPLACEQVTVVVVTYNSAHCLPALGSGLAQWPHLVVADNGSHDDTLAAVRHCLPLAQLLPLHENLGFGVANNRALAAVQTPFALLLNPDCLIHADDVQGLFDTAQRWPQAAIVAPQLIDNNGQPQLNYGWPRLAWPSDGPATEGVLCVGNVCGAVMLLRIAAQPAGGWFDPRFFLYHEDEDLCLRLFQAGQTLLIEPTVRITHLNRGSVRGPRPLQVEYLRGCQHAISKVLFCAKHLGPQVARPLRWRGLLASVLGLLLRLALPSPRLLARQWGRVCGFWRASDSY